MFKALINSFEKMSSFGVDEIVNTETQLRYRITNLIIMLSAICDTIFIFIAKYFLQNDNFATGLIITLLLFIISLALMHNKHFDLGRILSLVASIIGGLSAQYFVGASARVEILSFIHIIYITTLFSYKEKKLIALSGLLSLAYLTISYMIQFGLLPHDAPNISSNYLVAYNFMAGYAIVALVLIFLIKNNYEYSIVQERVSDLNHDLENALKVKNTVNNMIVHDLSTPVTILKNVSRRRWDNDTEKRMEMIKKSTTNIEDIINTVRNLDMNLQEVASDKQVMNIQDVLQDLEDIISEYSKEKNVQLKYDHSVNFDIQVNRPLFFNNILVNLLTNAVKFSNPNSHVEIVTYQKVNRLFFHILDNGRGMSEDAIAKAFNFNSNSSKLGSMGEKGTGKGLPIVKFSVDILGGQIELKNRLDGQSGIEVILELPA